MITDTIAGRHVPAHRPWPRIVVGADGWHRAGEELQALRWTLLGLWGDTGAVHMAVLDEPASDLAVLTLECRDGTFPSIGALHPPAIRLERARQAIPKLSALRGFFGREIDLWQLAPREERKLSAIVFSRMR